jgi:hypothetical protein
MNDETRLWLSYADENLDVAHLALAHGHFNISPILAHLPTYRNHWSISPSSQLGVTDCRFFRLASLQETGYPCRALDKSSG